MKSKYALILLIIIQFTLVNSAYSADNASSTIVQMDKAETIIYGEARRGGLIERLSELEAMLFGRSLPGTISERQMQLLNFIQTGVSEQPSLLFKLSVAEWAVNQAVQPFIPALGRLQKLEQELDGVIQEGKPVAMRVERILTMLLSDPVTQNELEVSSDKALKAQFLEKIGPGKSRKGDSVNIDLLDDFTIDNYLIAPKGSRIVAEVAEVTRPGAFGRKGEVKVALKYLQVLGPEEVMVKFIDPGTLGKGGEKNVAAAAGTSIVSTAILGPVGLLAGLLIRGDSLDVKERTQFYLQLSERTKISVFPIPSGLIKIDNPSSSASVNSNSDEIILIDTP